MVSNRITWNQVQAPDLSGYAREVGGAGAAFSQGMNSIAGGLGSIQAQRDMAKEKEDLAYSAMAREKMMQFQDSGQWGDVAKAGVFSSLGIDHTRLNQGDIDFATGRRSDLQTAESNDQRATMNDQNINKFGYDFDKQKVQDTRTEEQYHVDKAEAERLKALDAKTSKFAEEHGKKYKGDALAALNGIDMSPEERAMVEGKLANGTDWTMTTEESQLKAAEAVGDLGTRLEEAAVDTARKYSSEEQRHYAASRTRYGDSASPMDRGQMGKRFMELYTPPDGDETEFNTSFKDIEDQYGKYEERFKNLSGSIIASVMEDSVGPGGWWKGGVGLDTDKAEAMLGRLDDQMSNEALRSQYLEMNKEIDTQSKWKADVERAQRDYAIADTSKDPQLLAKAAKELERLQNEIPSLPGSELPEGANQTTPDPSSYIPTNTPGADLIPAAMEGAPSNAFMGPPMADGGVNPMQAPQGPMDSREAIDQFRGKVGEGIMGAFGAAGEGAGVVDTAAGKFLGGLSNMRGNTQKAVGFGAGLFAPSVGASMLDMGNESKEYGTHLAGAGVIGDLKDNMADNSTFLAASSLGMLPEEANQVAASMEALELGEGNLTVERKEVKAFVDAIEKQHKDADRTMTPEIASTVREAKSLLGIPDGSADKADSAARRLQEPANQEDVVPPKSEPAQRPTPATPKVSEKAKSRTYRLIQEQVSDNPEMALQLLGSMTGAAPQKISKVSDAIRQLNTKQSMNADKRKQLEGVVRTFMKEMQKNPGMNDQLQGLVDMLPKFMGSK